MALVRAKSSPSFTYSSTPTLSTTRTLTELSSAQFSILNSSNGWLIQASPTSECSTRDWTSAAKTGTRLFLGSFRLARKPVRACRSCGRRYTFKK